MAYTKIAQTPDIKDCNNVTWKVEIYLDDPAPPSLRTIEINGDMQNIRGESSPTHKYKPIVYSFININFIDEDGWLQNIIETHEDHELLVKILRTGQNYFKGYISVSKQKKKFLDGLTILPVKVYDGITRLKTFSDFSVFATGKHKISSLFRQIMNTLNLDQDCLLYLGIYPKTTTTPIRPGDFIGVDVYEYLTIKKDATYFDLLEDILTSLGLQLVSYLGIFYFRQIVYTEDATAYKQLVNYNTGASTYATVNNTVTRTIEDITKDPQKYFVNSIDEIVYKYPIDKDQYTEFFNRKKILNWYNPFFKEGTRYWTSSGGIKELKNSIQIEPGGYVYQYSSEIAEGTEFEFEISVTVIRWCQTYADIDFIPLYELGAFEVGPGASTYMYYDFNNPTIVSPKWLGSQTNKELLFESNNYVYPGSLVKPSFIPGYYKITITEKLSTAVPDMPNTGKAQLRVYLKGGLTSANNKPREITAQYNYAFVKLTKTAEENEGDFPTELQINCKKSNPRNTIIIEALHHDHDPYLPLTFYDMNDYYVENDGVTYYAKTQLWSPGDKPLMQLITERIIDFDANNIKAFDLEFTNHPDASTSFVNTVKANFDGLGETVFLPVYEQRGLLSNVARFILIEHKRKSITKTFDYEYVFDDN